MAAIQMQAVSKRFGKTEVIRGVDLDIHDGEFIVFVGPSGCGKSTLLRLIAGLEDLSSGHIAFDGEAVDELAPAERGIAMVFQSYALYPHMTVYDNLAFGLKLGRTQRVELDRRVREAAGILQIEHLLERKPKELSGGQRQRVAIGRAIVRSPRVFLFDEPLSNLDAALRVQMRIELAKLHRDLGTTMIYVTHDQVEAMTLASRIVVLNGGRVEQVGTPMELYRQPCNRFVAGFIGSPKMNFIEAKVATRDADQLALTLADDSRIQTTLPDSASLQMGDAVVLGLRPEHLPLTDLATSVLRGTVITVEHLGSEAYVYVDGPGDEPLVVKTDGQIKVAVGDEIAVGVPAEACYLFDREGRALARPDTGHHSG